MKVFIILMICIYVISVAEIIGSRILTTRKQNLTWQLEFTLLPILFPPLAPIVAFDIYTDAIECYHKAKRSHRVYQESLLCYLTHDLKSIDEWHSLKRERTMPSVKD